MLIYDSHCHLTAIGTDPRQFKIALPAITLADGPDLLNYRLQNPSAKIGCGVHPWQVNEINDLTALKTSLIQQINQLSPDFIGETGLDALKPNLALQLEVFKIHLELAAQFQLPIIIHCVRAYNQLLSILARFPGIRGVVHAFNGNRQLAQQLRQKNMYLGVGSIILNPTSQLAKSAAELPFEQLLLESDAPYMPALGKALSSSDNCLIYAQRLAQIRQISLMTVIRQANDNWQLLFGS